MYLHSSTFCYKGFISRQLIGSCFSSPVNSSIEEKSNSLTDLLISDTVPRFACIVSRTCLFYDFESSSTLIISDWSVLTLPIIAAVDICLDSFKFTLGMLADAYSSSTLSEKNFVLNSSCESLASFYPDWLHFGLLCTDLFFVKVLVCLEAELDFTFVLLFAFLQKEPWLMTLEGLELSKPNIFAWPLGG